MYQDVVSGHVSTRHGHNRLTMFGYSLSINNYGELLILPWLVKDRPLSYDSVWPQLIPGRDQDQEEAGGAGGNT